MEEEGVISSNWSKDDMIKSKFLPYITKEGSHEIEAGYFKYILPEGHKLERHLEDTSGCAWHIIDEKGDVCFQYAAQKIDDNEARIVLNRISDQEYIRQYKEQKLRFEAEEATKKKNGLYYFEKAQDFYERTLAASPYINNVNKILDNAYQTMEEAWRKLDDDVKKNTTMPEKITVKEHFE